MTINSGTGGGGQNFYSNTGTGGGGTGGTSTSTTSTTSGTISPPAMPAQYLYFQSQDFPNNNGPGEQSFVVMCGDKPPTVTTGTYAKWQSVERPLMTDVLVFQGYNLAEMTVELRFGVWTGDGGWHVGDDAGQKVESDIKKLERMSGTTAYWNAGLPQVVYMLSTTDLIPELYKHKRFESSPFPWVVSGLTWNDSWRNQNGYRIYQDVQVVLKEYWAPPGASSAQPTAAATTMAGSWYTTTSSVNTALKIAALPKFQSPLQDQQTLAKAIVSNSNNSKLKLSGVNTQIAASTRVFVPQHTII